MKVVVFAGGVGTRLWPLSRKNTPKQFEKIIGDKSTLQQTIDRLSSVVGTSDIYISTGKHYEETVRGQLPQIPQENFIFEPQMRDVGPAIGLAAFLLEKRYPNEPMAILWSDHYVKNLESFKKALAMAQDIISAKRGNFVFLGQKPRFANQNIGWIELGEKIDEKEQLSLYGFRHLKYRPKPSDAVSFFQNSGTYIWNLGYFVTTPRFLVHQFGMYVPEMYASLRKIQSGWGTESFEKILGEIYPTLEKISFDDAILEKLTSEGVFVVAADLQWSDVGAWEALKEALSQTDDENVTRGKVMLEDSRDSLAFNYTNQLCVGIDLSQMLIVSTEDVILVCPKTSVPKIKKLVEKLSGTPHEHLT